MDFVKALWGAEYPIFPILLVFSVTELPLFLRKLWISYYVPMYFALVPLNRINTAVGEYFGRGAYYDELHPENSIRKARIGALTGLFVMACLSPVVAGAFAGLLYPRKVIWGVVIVFIFIKADRAFRAYSDFREEWYVATKQGKRIWIFIYVLYGVTFVFAITAGYDWSSQIAAEGDYTRIFPSLRSLFFALIAVVIPTLISIFLVPELMKGGDREGSMRALKDDLEPSTNGAGNDV